MTSRNKTILDLARRLHRQQVAWRRHLHSHPELSNQEYETTRFLKRELKQLGLGILPVKHPTGVIAELKGDGKGPTVAIRADIDALPVLEATGLPYRSRVPGRMHACGHDVHTATVLGTAAVLAQLRRNIAGNVRFIFQPAEEMPPGGARPMIESGAMKNVSVVFGLHVDPHVPVGKIGLRDGAVFAANSDFDITILGKGSHAAKPHLGVDAIVVAAQVINRVQEIVSRENDPIEPLAISFGQIQGGLARNVVADQVKLVGTARWLSERHSHRIPGLIRKAVRATCAAYGARCEIEEIGTYPLLSNDPSVNRLYRSTWEALFGKGRITLTPQVLGSEDFACYLEKAPGAMFRLGVMNRKIGAVEPWHSTKFKVDEESMYYGTTLLASATLAYLQGGDR